MEKQRERRQGPKDAICGWTLTTVSVGYYEFIKGVDKLWM